MSDTSSPAPVPSLSYFAKFVSYFRSAVESRPQPPVDIEANSNAATLLTQKPPLAFAVFPLTKWQRALLSHSAISPSNSDHPLYHICAKWLGRLFIVPIANLTPENFRLQLYLLRAFHLDWLSFLGHGCIMPLVLIELTYLFGRAFCIPLGLSWAAAALCSGRKLWAVMSCGLAALIAQTAPRLGALNPLSTEATIGILSFLIALSHGAEKLYPPRAAGGLSNWMRLSEMVKERGLLNVASNVLFSLACGTFQEGVASLRLFPYFLLKLMTQLGYKDTLSAKIERAADILMKTERAAVDFGGFTTDQEGALSAEQLETLCSMTAKERVQNFKMVIEACQLEAFFREKGYDVNELKELEAILTDCEIWDDSVPIPPVPITIAFAG